VRVIASASLRRISHFSFPFWVLLLPIRFAERAILKPTSPYCDLSRSPFLCDPVSTFLKEPDSSLRSLVGGIIASDGGPPFFRISRSRSELSVLWKEPGSICSIDCCSRRVVEPLGPLSWLEGKRVCDVSLTRFLKEVAMVVGLCPSSS